MKCFYPEDLLEYYYNEMPADKREELKEALQQSWPLNEKMEVIRQAAQRLDKSMERPRQESIDQILKYASLHSKIILQ